MKEALTPCPCLSMCFVLGDGEGQVVFADLPVECRFHSANPRLGARVSPLHHPIGPLGRKDLSKFLLEGGGWLLMRESGTEPLVRLYLEAETDAALDEIAKAGETYIRGE